MTTIKATCPGCGEVDLMPSDVSLLVASHAPLSWYGFTCPKCAEEVRKPADTQVVSLLMSGGVQPVVWDVPAEALEPHRGAALSYDDLLDFGLGLGARDYLSDLAALPLAS